MDVTNTALRSVPTAAPETAFTSERFRHVMGHVPTGVVVVAATTGEGPVGLTVGSFVSASLEPALVGFFVAHTSTSWPQIEPVGRFSVNVLDEDAEAVCRAFAHKGGDKFAGLSWQPSRLGSPVLDGALAGFDCTFESVSEAGDHVFVLGRVHDLWVRPAGRPLVFCHGSFQRLMSA